MNLYKKFLAGRYNLFIYFLTDRSTTKSKTFDPSWNESFIHEVTNAKNIGLTVFHDAAIPPDDFVANCTIPFEDLAHRDKEQQDFWVNKFYFQNVGFCFLCSFFSFQFAEMVVHIMLYSKSSLKYKK